MILPCHEKLVVILVIIGMFINIAAHKNNLFKFVHHKQHKGD